MRSLLHLDGFPIPQSRIREFSWLAAGQLTTLVLSIISVKLTTSIGPEEYGKYTLAASVIGVLSLAFFGPLEQGYIRLYFDYAKHAHTRWVYGYSLLRVLLYSAVGLIAISGLTAIAAHAMFDFSYVFAGAAAFMIVMSLISVPITGMLNAMRLRRDVALVQIVERILIIALLFLLLSKLQLSAATVMFALGLAGVVTFALRLASYLRSMRPEKTQDHASQDADKALPRQIYSQVLTYSAPFVVWGILTWMQSNGERWVINGMLTASDVGRYGLAANIINSSAVLLFTILTQFVTPIIFNRFSDGSVQQQVEGRRIIRLYSTTTLALFGLASVGLYFAGEIVIQFVSSKAFVVDSLLFSVLTIGIGLFYVGQAYATLGLALKKPAAYIFAKTSTAIVAVLLYLAGCYWGGLIGIVWAMVAANSLYLALILRTNRSLSQIVENA
jgi:O-antigen/teichoic acid export membrane protein